MWTMNIVCSGATSILDRLFRWIKNEINQKFTKTQYHKESKRSLKDILWKWLDKFLGLYPYFLQSRNAFHNPPPFYLAWSIPKYHHHQLSNQGLVCLSFGFGQYLEKWHYQHNWISSSSWWNRRELLVCLFCSISVHGRVLPILGWEKVGCVPN